MIGGTGLWVLDRPRANMAADTVTLVAVLGASFALVGPLGVLGIAIATLASSLLGATTRLLTMFRLMALIGGGRAPCNA